ncbi:MAG TPA: hypothetical protein DIW30_08300 [Bacteroidales bacterium]|nr:hypothetical protein [Bacteroidales bacterium]
MKKSLFLGAVVALTAALVGCNPSQKPDDASYTSISLKPNELVMVAGDTTRVNLLYEPTTAAAPAAEWSSSDTAIVKVANGIVIAKDTFGTATVTAKVGELTATCEVTVDYYENLFAPSAIYYFPDTKVPVGEVIDTVMPSGKSYKIQLQRLTMLVLNSLDFDGEAGLGEGQAIFADAALYFVTEGEYKDKMFSDRRIEFVNDSALLNKEYAAMAGSFDPNIVAPVLEDFIKSEYSDIDVDTYMKGAKGAYIGDAEMTDEGVRYWPFFNGIITDGYIGYAYDNEGKVTGMDYDFHAKWAYVFYGIEVDWDTSYEEGTYVFVKPYEAAFSEEYHYTTKGTKQAPRFAGANKNLNKKAGKKVFMGKPEKLRAVPMSAMR